jgi:hypothetical protein
MQLDEIRKRVKTYAPASIVRMLRVARRSLGKPPIDDVVLADYDVLRDDNPNPRFNLVLPRLEAGSDFGGFATGIDIFCRLFLEINKTHTLDLRVFISDVIAATDPSIFVKRAGRVGLEVRDDQIELIRTTADTISVRDNDMFMTYNWWTTLNFAKVRNTQAAMFNRAPAPLVWLMQDYEPAFMEFSSGHMLAREAYDETGPLWGVINSSNLSSYMEAVGHQPERKFVFEPVISDSLRPFLGHVETSKRTKRILVYGRPNVERNCFPALVRGLRLWTQKYPEFADWEVLSAGTPHNPIDLGDGRKLLSVGKLPLDGYAQMLLETSVGVSLMASPHPSYPPLEMSHFGVRTITNTYVYKDLAEFHPNIVSLPSISADALAAALAQCCALHGEPISSGANPEFLRTETYPFMNDLRDAMISKLG